MTPPGVLASLRELTRRVWGALSGRRTDHDLQRELAGHLALAEDELCRQGHAPNDAARLARAAAGGRIQALEALREQRGLPWLASSWLDVRLGLRLLVRNWGLTLVGVVAAVFGRAFLQIGAGSAVGMLAAYLVGRYVPIEQIGGLPIPGVLPGAAAFMLLVGVLASLGPARRGLRIDPTEALRSE